MASNKYLEKVAESVASLERKQNKIMLPMLGSYLIGGGAGGWQIGKGVATGSPGRAIAGIGILGATQIGNAIYANKKGLPEITRKLNEAKHRDLSKQAFDTSALKASAEAAYGAIKAKASELPGKAKAYAGAVREDALRVKGQAKMLATGKTPMGTTTVDRVDVAKDILRNKAVQLGAGTTAAVGAGVYASKKK